MIERGKKCPSAALLERIEHALKIEQIELQAADGRVEKTSLAKLRLISPRLFDKSLTQDIGKPVAVSPKVYACRPFDVRVETIYAALKVQDFDPRFRKATTAEKSLGIVAVIVLPDFGSGGWEILVRAIN